MSNEKFRLFLRFNTSNVPGEPSGRQSLLQEHLFSVIGRVVSSFDHIHTPGLIDSPNQIAYLVVDVNVGEKGHELSNIPVKCYKVVYSKGEP